MKTLKSISLYEYHLLCRLINGDYVLFALFLKRMRQ